MAKKKIKKSDPFKKVETTHKVWHKFSGWLAKKYGKDLWNDWQRHVLVDDKGQKRVFKYRNFNDYKLSQRLVGYEVMESIEKYVKKYCPEIKVMHCDDEVHAGSLILLVPHVKMGITVIFIPQCTSIQNQFFLYDNHCKMLLKGLKEMSYVYKNSL